MSQKPAVFMLHSNDDTPDDSTIGRSGCPIRAPKYAADGASRYQQPTLQVPFPRRTGPPMLLFHDPALLPTPTVAISACLAGDHVRYDGDHKAQPLVLQTLARHVIWVRFCPEVAAGFGIPRPPIQLRRRDRGSKDSDIRVVEVAAPSRDRTNALQRGVADMMQQLGQQPPDAIVLKARSPSCGPGNTPLFNDDGNRTDTLTDGLMAHACRERFANALICDEEALTTPSACQALALTLLIRSDISHCSAAQKPALRAHYCGFGIDTADMLHSQAMQQLAGWSSQRIAQAFDTMGPAS